MLLLCRTASPVLTLEMLIVSPWAGGDIQTAMTRLRLTDLTQGRRKATAPTHQMLWVSKQGPSPPHAASRSKAGDADAAPPSEDGEDAGGAEVKKPGKKAAEKKPKEPADQPPESSETPEEESGDAQPPSPEMPPQSPVQAPAPAEAPPPKSSTPSAPPKVPGPSATPPVTANTPGITTPRPNGVPGNHNTGTQSPADLAWVGKSMFKIFGGLF
ncbi:hypothetical protein LshimejAT787_1601230 [Lyophyllum shimeji]|uniref:Uncharacterized protein n=1 Tax=Lyophyllum shimeji TaxID=47721 RepID=A0A9P3PZ33_LYOSH|nr:hypothetical protein LshimejAT787_1601230 [Lyophyllum shimeji]